MTLPIRTLPVAEQWDCHSCGNCCWGVIVALNDGDLERLKDQRWDEHPDFRGIRTIERLGFWQKGFRVAHRPDGNCVFLTPEKLCRIHQEYGEAAKPTLCRMYPFQLVPMDDVAFLTLRRSCPSAAMDQGRNIKEYLSSVRALAEQGKKAAEGVPPPSIARGYRHPWHDVHRVFDVFERFLIDERYPPVRRLVHGLHFCDLLEMCRLGGMTGAKLQELLDMLEDAAVDEASETFRDRKTPRRLASGVFRQTVLEHLRLHPTVRPEKTWAERMRLIRAAMGFARGRGTVPRVLPDQPPATFEALEEPLGTIDIEVLRPITAFYARAAASRHYAMLTTRSWPVLDSFRALAATYPVAMWTLRLVCGGQRPTVQRAVDVVAMIDRGQRYAALAGGRHRARVRRLAQMGQLQRLAAWYAR